MGDPGRTGPHDPRRQSDLDLGFETEREARLSTPVAIKLTDYETGIVIARALDRGFKRENPNGRWTDHEKRGAVRLWLAYLIEEDLKR